MQKIKHEEGDVDAWVCNCGNTPGDDGFYPCDDRGNELEPSLDSGWDGIKYVCHNPECGLIINQNTLEIIGKRN